MSLKLTAAVVAGMILMLPGRSNAQELNAIDVLMSMDQQYVAANPQFDPAPPVRQTAEVWLMRPTWIGTSILQGHYVIEHDNDRMARGEPCTHIYAFGDREKKPVVAFHCVHLERGRAQHTTATLISLSDGMLKLTEFQFAGESAAHGYPSSDR